MTPTQGFALLAILLIFIVLWIELVSPTTFQEGFTSMLSGSTSILTIPSRGDIGPHAEEAGFLRDPRYFHGYADVSRTGQKHDYCRLVSPDDDPENPFFACALAGTENLASTTFRTPSVKQGFKISRDDYMISAKKETGGRAAYCRILRHNDGSWQPLCNRANDTRFDSRLIVDPSPPEEIQTLLSFYTGCLFWLRLFDDIVDSTSTVKCLLSGGLMIDETPDQETTQGLRFDGVSQFIRLTDSVDISLGDRVAMRSMRAFQCWVYFDEFTNNAHIFDFGNGAGRDTVFLGIIGRGDGDSASSTIRPPLLCDATPETATVPDGPSGAQPVRELSPQVLMASTRANVDEYSCVGFEELPRRLEHSNVSKALPRGSSDRATLLYEIWDKQQRKFRIQIPGAIPIRKWTHICITASSEDAFRPTLDVFINGTRVLSRPSGFLPSTNTLSHCYLGKSNWSSTTEEGQFENKDELFKGRLFDMRFYKVPLSDTLIEQSYLWGKNKLGLE